MAGERLKKLGPGLLFAASAVGVSHLVQSTRAGADFGLTMGVLIIAICVLKYPAFRFGAEYAALTGESVVAGYARSGRALLLFFLAALLVEGLAVIPAVSLVATGLTLNLFGLAANENMVTMAIVIGLSLALALGRYRLLERSAKACVIVFAVLTLVATGAALRLLPGADSLAAPVALTQQNLNFSVAVAGWMPVGMGAAVFISLWVLARGETTGQRPSVADVRFDFNLGYAATVLLALCFLLMGTLLMFGSGIDLAAGAGVFATELVGLFVDSLGSWIWPVISIAALAVMYSTVITVIDGFPRVYADVIERLLGWDSGRRKHLYVTCLVAQSVVALILLTTLFSSFAVFIDFATTAGFVSAPVIAILNHRVMNSEAVPVEGRPAPWLRRWSAAAAVALTAASLIYMYFRFVA